MTLRFARLAATIVLSTALLGQVPSVDERATCCRRRVLVPMSRFTISSIRQMYEDFRTTCPSARVTQLEVLVEGKAAATYLKMAYRRSIDSSNISVSDFHEMQRLRLGIAEVIDIGGNTVLRMREQSGAVQRIVLSGTDPLYLQIGDDRVEIVFLTIDDLSIRGRSATWAQFFVVCHGLLTEEHLSELGLAIQRRIGFRNGWVLFRADRWFIAGGGYPPFNPYFPTPAQEPNWNDVIVSNVGSCVLDGDAHECRVHTSEINPIRLPPLPELKFPPPVDPLRVFR